MGQAGPLSGLPQCQIPWRGLTEAACPKCYKNTTDEQKARYMSRQKQVDLAKKRNQKHIGPREEIRKSKI